MSAYLFGDFRGLGRTVGIGAVGVCAVGTGRIGVRRSISGGHKRAGFGVCGACCSTASLAR